MGQESPDFNPKTIESWNPLLFFLSHFSFIRLDFLCVFSLPCVEKRICVFINLSIVLAFDLHESKNEVVYSYSVSHHRSDRRGL